MKKIRTKEFDWSAFAGNLQTIRQEKHWLNLGQLRSLDFLKKQLPNNGVIIADEVGMGKTRIAVAVAKAVVKAGGRVAVLIPPGLGYQWKSEFRQAEIDVIDPLRSVKGVYKPWRVKDQSGEDDTVRKWSDEEVLLISHHFSNWRHTATSNVERINLLRELYVCDQRSNRKRLPRNANYNSKGWIQKMANDIFKTIPKSASHPARKDFKEVIENFRWTQTPLEGLTEKDKERFRLVVGLALGQFDLIIIDEAHKRRGSQSGLSKMLDGILRSNNNRVLALTATPIELDLNDWSDLLKRIGVDPVQTGIKKSIQQYSEAVKNMRALWPSEESEKLYNAKSKQLQKSLERYLVRRRKSEEPIIEQFRKIAGTAIYRAQKKITIDPIDIQMHWRKSICAAEALSWLIHIKRDDENSIKSDHTTKRLREKFANMHGLFALMSKEALGERKNQVAAKTDDAPSKKKAREEFWKNRLRKLQSELYTHPALEKTISTIEEYTSHGEKVLVFGTFIQPLQTLVSLLNARELIRSVLSGRFWPQRQLSIADIRWIQIALHQLGKKIDQKFIEKELRKGEAKMNRSRSKFRKEFFSLLEQTYDGNRNCWPFKLIQNISKAGKDVIYVFTSAIYEHIYGTDLSPETITPLLIKEAYENLLKSALDRDADEDEKTSFNDDDDLAAITEKLISIIEEEYSTQTPRFAKLMYGSTKHENRRLIQASFNRLQSPLKVLVAQSTVGREGLNLHEACKTVVLFHLEWNPAVVEQQIGRVDRVNSLWEKNVKDYLLQNDAEPPKINFHPVIFKGTYDEEKWKVLEHRWQELKAQLHGEVIAEEWINDLSEDEKIKIRNINSKAPDFSPGKIANK